MRKLRALDLFCCAGGAGVGLHRAGFDVVGVDIKPQPNYPFEFHQADALTFPLDGFDFIWASPPCQAYTSAAPLHKKKHPELIEPIRDRLVANGKPYCIENVPGAPLINPITLCGLTFGLRVKRHRLFECSFPVETKPCPKGHHGDWLIVFGWSALRRSKGQGTGPKKDRGKTKGNSVPHAEACEAMGVDWPVTRQELSQSIPPAYSEHIGRSLLACLQAGEEEDNRRLAFEREQFEIERRYSEGVFS